jgi:hypothetical protein
MNTELPSPVETLVILLPESLFVNILLKLEREEVDEVDTE